MVVPLCLFWFTVLQIINDRIHRNKNKKNKGVNINILKPRLPSTVLLYGANVNWGQNAQQPSLNFKLLTTNPMKTLSLETSTKGLL